MKFLSIALFLVAAATRLLAADPAAPKLKVLVLTGGHGYNADALAKLFNDDPDIVATFARHTLTPGKSEAKLADAYEREDLYSYDVVVLYDSPIGNTEAQRARFLGLFDKGIGVVVLHHAYLAYPMWPEYERIAGGKYVYLAEQMVNGVTSSDYTRGMVDIPVTIATKEHPATAGLSDFTLRDERYTNMHMLGAVTPLLKSGDQLLAWSREEKKSRVIGTILGHGQTAYSDPNFRRFLWQSIRWCGRK